METYVLKKPITTANGENITVIEMNLEDLSAIDLERCEKEARAFLGKNKHMAVPETNKTYLACVAAKASGLMLGDIRSLGGKDYTQVTLVVQNFLLGGDLEDEEEETTSTKTSGETSKPTTDQEMPTNY